MQVLWKNILRIPLLYHSRMYLTHSNPENNSNVHWPDATMYSRVKSYASIVEVIYLLLQISLGISLPCEWTQINFLYTMKLQTYDFTLSEYKPCMHKSVGLNWTVYILRISCASLVNRWLIMVNSLSLWFSYSISRCPL